MIDATGSLVSCLRVSSPEGGTGCQLAGHTSLFLRAEGVRPIPDRQRRTRWQWRLTCMMIEENAVRLFCDQNKLGQERWVAAGALSNRIDSDVGRDNYPLDRAGRVLQRLCPVLRGAFIDNIMEIYARVGCIKLRCVDILKNSAAI